LGSAGYLATAHARPAQIRLKQLALGPETAHMPFDSRALDRIKRRMPCELLVRQHWHSGRVLDLSARGLFVQTNAKPRPRERVELRIACDGTEALHLFVEVARLKRVPPSLLCVAGGGIGVRIVIAPEEYFQFLCRLVPPEQQAPLVFAAEPGEGPRFRVRVREIGGSRSRRIEVSASDREAARGRALEGIGEGWKILDVEELRPPATDRAPGDEL